MRVYVGVTDTGWYRFLAARPHLEEVNFWQPGGGNVFRALQIGEPFLFKSRYPENAIVGGGFFSGWVRLKVSEAWELLGESNGAATPQRMLEQIVKYRNRPPAENRDPVIGCVLLRDVVFFGERDKEPAPPDFAKNLVQGRTYDLDAVDEASVLHRAVYRLIEPGVYERTIGLGKMHVPGPVWGESRLTRPRLGQQSFKAMVLSAYDRRCAITGGKIRPVLEAAHIVPVTRGGEHRLDNGLLLRSDVHIMFDRGYLSVDSKYRLKVSPRLRDEFGNGEQFYARDGTEISLPDRRDARPHKNFLEWHSKEVFLAS